MEDNVLLNIKDLCVWYKIYNGYLKVLNGVNLIVREGERIAIVGETGCGKTTTLKSILRIIPPGDFKIPKGQIIYKNRDILRMNPDQLNELRSSEIAMIFQDPSSALNPVFTIGSQVSDVIKYSSSFKKTPKKSEIKELLIESFKAVYLPDPERMIDNYPFQLSGGMKQRVCIAMSICTPRNLILADEPGTSLDVTIQDQIMKLLEEVAKKQNTSLILVTHSLGVAREMTDRTYVMYAGSILETATSKEIIKNPVHPYTIGLIESVPKITGGGISHGIFGRIPSYVNPPTGCRFAPRCRYKKTICIKEIPQLYEIEKDHMVACHLIGSRYKT